MLDTHTSDAAAPLVRTPIRELLRQHGYTEHHALGVWLDSQDKQAFAYNDGDAAESYLMQVFDSVHDLSVASMELRAAIRDWPSMYHLSQDRANLLRPLSSLLTGRVLEIGSGCGAITRFLGESGAEVLALEGSARRAALTRSRCRGLDGVTVMSDNFQYAKLQGPFDAVTLIGVLEYSPTYIQAPNPIGFVLEATRALLAEHGVLVIAIENQLGIKYMSGAPEDHLGKPYAGLDNLYAGDVVTFGRQALLQRLHAAGFAHVEFFYPFPDYKLPNTVLNNAMVQSDLALIGELATPTQQTGRPYTPLFSEQAALRTLACNRLLGELANSFLVVASIDQPVPHALRKPRAWSYATHRRRCFAKATYFSLGSEGCTVERQLLYPNTPSDQHHIMRWAGKTEVASEGELFILEFDRVLQRPGWRLRDLAPFMRDYVQFLDEAAAPGPKPLHRQLPGHFFDCIPKNLLRRPDGALQAFDLEWSFVPPLFLGHVLLRGTFLTLLHIPSCASPAAGTPTRMRPFIEALLRHIGLAVSPAEYGLFSQQEALAQTSTMGNRVDPSFALNAERFPVLRPSIEALCSPLAPAVAKRYIETKFDRGYYLKTYPDVARAGVDPLQHYLFHGAREGRNPNAQFDTRAYETAHPEVRALGTNPLLHAILQGRDISTTAI